jgi:hypothetical protein
MRPYSLYNYDVFLIKAPMGRGKTEQLITSLKEGNLNILIFIRSYEKYITIWNWI